MRHLFHFDIKPRSNYGDAVLFALVRQLVDGFRAREKFLVTDSNLRHPVGPRKLAWVNGDFDAALLGGGVAIPHPEAITPGGPKHLHLIAVRNHDTQHGVHHWACHIGMLERDLGIAGHLDAVLLGHRLRRCREQVATAWTIRSGNVVRVAGSNATAFRSG